MGTFLHKRAGRAARCLALIGVLFALLATTHVHSNKLSPPESCAPCAHLHGSSAITPTVHSLAVTVAVTIVATEPSAAARHGRLPQPVGRAPPADSGSFSI